jgi:hypothetical protein
MTAMRSAGVFFALWCFSAASFFVNGPQQLVFGQPASFQVSSFPLQCATPPQVRVTGPLGQLVFGTAVSPCSNGVTTVTFQPCAAGPHVVAVLDATGAQQVAALTTVAQPQPVEYTYVDGPAVQTVFEFGGLVPQQ